MPQNGHFWTIQKKSAYGLNGAKYIVAHVQSALYAYALLACANPRRPPYRASKKNIFARPTISFKEVQK